MTTQDSQPLTKADGRDIIAMLTKLHEDVAELRGEVHDGESRLLRHMNFLDERNRKELFDGTEARYDQLDMRVTQLEQHTGITGR